MKYFVLILICAAINSLDDTSEEYRKHYGLSFHRNCGNYFITFKCLTACKSMGFQVFRLDHKCKCSCHELKTSTILPAFIWRTNGTTKKIPAVFSPKLYAIFGTMSPPPSETVFVPTEKTDTVPVCPTVISNTVITTFSTDIATSNSAANGSESTASNTMATTGA